MNDIQLFNYGNSAVRVVMYGNPPVAWFVAKDVCDILGYANPRDALSRHLDEDEKADVVIHDGSQRRSMNIINESGLYCLTLRSNMPKAKSSASGLRVHYYCRLCIMVCLSLMSNSQNRYSTAQKWYLKQQG